MFVILLFSQKYRVADSNPNPDICILTIMTPSLTIMIPEYTNNIVDVLDPHMLFIM